MKVLVYTSLFPNQMEPHKGIFIKQRMFHFAKLDGCSIKVVAPIPYCPPCSALGQRYLKYSQIKRHEIMDGLDVYHPRYLLIPKISMLAHPFLLFLFSLNSLRNLMSSFPFDLIDSHYIYPDGLAAILLGKVLKKPVILSARGSDIHQFSHFKLYRPIIRHTLRQAKHVISVCNALKDEMISLNIGGKKITVIPNGVDVQRFYPIDKREARAKLSLCENSKIILSIGSLIPLKGFHLIIDTIPVLLKHYPHLKLYIIGDGPYRSSLQKQITSLSLDNHVSLLGELPNTKLNIWYNAADVFCLASSREGWANVIMESLACGTPVVATRVYGAPEILTSQDFGILVDRNHKSLCAGLKKALETTWGKKHIRKHVEYRDWIKVAIDVKDVYDKAIE